MIYLGNPMKSDFLLSTVLVIIQYFWALIQLDRKYFHPIFSGNGFRVQKNIYRENPSLGGCRGRNRDRFESVVATNDRFEVGTLYYKKEYSTSAQSKQVDAKSQQNAKTSQQNFESLLSALENTSLQNACAHQGKVFVHQGEIHQLRSLNASV